MSAGGGVFVLAGSVWPPGGGWRHGRVACGDCRPGFDRVCHRDVRSGGRVPAGMGVPGSVGGGVRVGWVAMRVKDGCAARAAWGRGCMGPGAIVGAGSGAGFPGGRHARSRLAAGCFRDGLWLDWTGVAVCLLCLPRRRAVLRFPRDDVRCARRPGGPWSGRRDGRSDRTRDVGRLRSEGGLSAWPRFGSERGRGWAARAAPLLASRPGCVCRVCRAVWSVPCCVGCFCLCDGRSIRSLWGEAVWAGSPRPEADGETERVGRRGDGGSGWAFAVSGPESMRCVPRCRVGDDSGGVNGCQAGDGPGGDAAVRLVRGALGQMRDA